MSENGEKFEEKQSTDDSIEIIRVINVEEDIKANIDRSDKVESPKTAKDLFSDFKPESGSDVELDEEEEDSFDDDEPLSKRFKKSKSGTGRKKQKADKTNGNISRKKYKREWEEIPSVKPWLSESVHGDCYFYCRFCKKDYKCGKSEIFKHMSSMKHKKNITHPPSQKVIKRQMFRYRGLLCPVFTPFNKSRTKDINYDAIRPYAKFLKACGIKGVLVNDVMGEGMSLTIEERKRTLEIWSEYCSENNIFLMVQVGGAPLKNVIELAVHAESVKVGAIVLLPDLYHRPRTHLDLIRYIKSVSNSIGSTPILYHHFPKYTCLEIDMKPFLLDITGEIDTFVGLIYSSTDLQETLSAMELNPDKFVVFMGTDEGMLGAVASGFTCIMGNTLSFLPKLAESVCCCIKNGEIKSAQASQNLLRKAVFNIYNYGETVPSLKAAMSIVTKLPMEVVREPLQTMWEGNVAKLKEKLHEIGII